MKYQQAVAKKPGLQRKSVILDQELQRQILLIDQEFLENVSEEFVEMVFDEESALLKAQIIKKLITGN